MTISKFPPENPAVVMSDTQPSTKVDGTIWVDTDSDVPVVNPTDYVSNSLVDAAGDLLVGSANDTVGRLGLGSNGQVLTVDTAGTGVAKVKWATPAATGGALNEQTGDYTLAVTDAEDTVEIDSSTDRTVTLPDNTTAAIPVGSRIDIFRAGSGAVNITPASGVTLQNGGNDGASVSGQWKIARLLKYAANAWTITGDYLAYTIARALFGGGTIASDSNVIDYVTISTTGNATDFGDLTVARQQVSACSSSTRGLFAGGIPTTGLSNVIDYVTIGTTGNATDFGDLIAARRGVGACSSSTRGLFAGGLDSTWTNAIDYVTIASTGNATDFGDLSVARLFLAGCGSSTRGIFGGGENSPGHSNVIDYVTIATTGNATDFGDLSVTRTALSACSSSTRGLFGSGWVGSNSNVIDYVTIATTGNATDFGDLTVARHGLAATSSSTLGLFAGGAGPSNVIDYVTIATTGNATDFGDLTAGRQWLGACSNVHGGLA